ncbi:TonB-dependent receptor [Sphingomonas sp. CL5.1]|uniref:TonB-dependent receptor n=1 Tax=Sphingomonas sp. CL5.1 TaxID=2653203 RepID=UPI001581FD36|nr:TonB-dependent receptor [Sphingomonas sp. CL5.1]QKS00446.1 TonB-dependent receptor [Sphingomonas sp. CL5.1]
MNGHYELADNVTAFWEGTYAHTRTGYSNAAVPMGTASFINNFQLDLRNPYLPASLRTLLGALDTDNDSLVSVSMNRRLNELGLRSTDQRRDFWRLVGGLKGNLTDRLKWEFFVNYGKSTIEDHQYGGVRLDHFQAGLLTNPANPMACASADPGCVVLDLFGANSLTPAMTNYLSAGDLVNRTRVEQTQIGGDISGTLFSLPAGDVGISVGAEYRRESSAFMPDPLYTQGIVLARFAGLQPTQGSYDVKEANAELYVPILANTPGFQLLAFETGVRVSDYSSVGSVIAYKFGGEYTPFEGLKLRGSFERAVRAPNVNELYGGLTSTAPLATDFCNATASRTTAQRTFCQQLGVPAALLDVFTQQNAFITVVSGGNPNLKAETSNTWSFGAVLRPTFVPRLQITVDYYNIEVNNAIAGFGGGLAGTIGACAANMSLSNPFCAPLTHRAEDGQLFQVPLLNANIANLTSEGVDFALSYNFPVGAGKLAYSLAGTYLIKNTSQGGPGLPVIDCAGFIGGGACGDVNPHWRLNQRLTYSIDKVQVTLNHRMIGSAQDGRIASAIANGVTPPSLAVPSTPNIHYFDLGFFLDVNEHFSIHASVNNIFDRLPPYQLFELDTYDPIGRAFTVGANVKF